MQKAEFSYPTENEAEVQSGALSLEKGKRH